MMTAIDVIDSIEINTSPETVFNVIADYGNMHKWFPVYNCKVLNANKIAEGVTVEHIYGKPPFVLSHFIRRIDRIVPGSRLEESYIDGDLRGTGVWTFEKKGNATIVAYDCKVDGSTWFTRLSFKLIGNSAHSNTYQKLLKALKQHCESL